MSSPFNKGGGFGVWDWPDFFLGILLYGKTLSIPCKKIGKSATLLIPPFFAVFYRFCQEVLQGGFPVKLFCFLFFRPPKKVELTTKVSVLDLPQNSYFSQFSKTFPKANSKAQTFCETKLFPFNNAWTQHSHFLCFSSYRRTERFKVVTEQLKKWEFFKICSKRDILICDKSGKDQTYTVQKHSKTSKMIEFGRVPSNSRSFIERQSWFTSKRAISLPYVSCVFVNFANFC